MRLLTEEVAKVIDNAKMADIVDGRFSSKPYAEEVISITLKAVGEWIWKHTKWDGKLKVGYFTAEEFDALCERGEMPEEVK